MLSNALGTIVILLGILFFRYPESLRRRLRRKAVRKLRRYFFAALFCVGILFISVGWRHEGLLPKVLVILGIVVLLKGLLFLNSKATEKVTEWILARPVLHLKVFAVGQIALGVAILLGL